MRCAVLVDSNGSTPGPKARGVADGDLTELVRGLGFEVIASLDEVTACDTLLVHLRGDVGDGSWLREWSERIAKCDPEAALVLAELTHGGPNADALAAAELVEAARASIDPVKNGLAAIVSVRAASLGTDPLAFTRVIARLADGAVDPNGCARLSEVTDRIRNDRERAAATQSHAVTNVEGDFVIARSDRPSLSSLLALADGARDRAEWAHARAGYRAALMAATDAETRATAWSRLGAMERARCDEEEATRAYENAVAARPSDRESIDALAAMAEEAGDVKRAVVWASKRVPLLDSTAEKVDELFAIARSYVQDLGDMNGALAALERARAIEPRDDVLEALRRSYRKQSDWPKLVEITGALADNAPTAEERAARRFAQARIALDRMGDKARAIGFLSLALDDDPTHDEALDVLIEVRTALGELPELARALTRLVSQLESMGEVDRARDVQARLSALPNPAAETASTTEASELSPDDISVDLSPADLSLQIAPVAAELSMDDLTEDTDVPPSATSTLDTAALDTAALKLSDLDAAFGALMKDTEGPPSGELPAVLSFAPAEDAVRIPAAPAVPADAERTAPFDSIPAAAEAEAQFAALESQIVRHTTVAAELMAAGDEGGALEELEAAILETPFDITLHERLYDMHSHAERYDRALLSAQVLEEIGGPSTEREAWLEQARPAGALRVRALLDATAWELLRAEGADDVIEALFAAISRPAILAQIDDRRARRRLPVIDLSRKQPRDSTASIAASFRWAARVLGVECPELYVLDDVPGDVAAVPAAEPSTILGPAILTGLSTKDLAFIVARHLTYYRPEHAVLLYFPTIQELTFLVLAAVQTAMPAVPIPPSVAAQVASLQARIAVHLTDAERVKMTAAVERLEGRGGRLELGSWVKSVEMTAARVGLVLSGDLRSAMSRIRVESRATSCVTVEEERRDLVAFCASRAHADIRTEYAMQSASWPPAQTSGVRSRDDYATPTWNLVGTDRAV